MQAFLAGRPKGEWYSSLITNPPVSDFPPAMYVVLGSIFIRLNIITYSHLPYAATLHRT